jgi:hypothetical protein
MDYRVAAGYDNGTSILPANGYFVEVVNLRFRKYAHYRNIILVKFDVSTYRSIDKYAEIRINNSRCDDCLVRI